MIQTNDQVILTQKQIQGVEVLTFPLFERLGGVRHIFTTRHGGVSKGIFCSMNVSYTRGDQKEAVDENFRRIAAVMGAQPSDFVFTDQTHTANVRVVTREDAGKGLTRARDYADVDGLVTNEPHLVLSAFFADCVPLYFYDPVRRVIGLSHSGWRGTVSRIGARTVETMQEHFGCEPADIYAAVGPSICHACYEISADVAKQFATEFPSYEQEILTDDKNGKYHLDLWKTNEKVLTDAGIQKEHLSVTNICTCCNADKLFSHRATKGKRGNLGAFLSLK
jgi:hypothetical protein